MSPAKLDGLQNRAQTRADALARQRTTEWEKFYTRLEKEAEEERKAQVDGLHADAASGALTLDRLEDMRRMRVATGEDYRRLREMVTRPKESPSDQATIDDVDAKLYRSTPQITEGDLLALRRSGKLNDKDFVERARTLVSRQDHIRAEGRTIANQELSQAEQLINKSLGFTGPFDQLDNDTKNLLAGAWRELTARAEGGGMGGKEKAAPVAIDILSRVQPIRDKSLTLSADKVQKTFRFPTRETLEGNRQRIGEPAYYEELRKFSQFDRLSQPQSTTKTKTPGGTLRRKPGTPVVTDRE